MSTLGRCAPASWLALLLSFSLALPVQAMPAFRGPLQLAQPDGVTFSVRLWGNEWANGHETIAGYTILRDGGDVWRYAELVEGELLPGATRADLPAPAGLTPGLRPLLPVAASSGPPGGDGPQQTPPAPGSHPLIVLLADFTPSTSLGTTAADWEAAFFSGDTASAPDSLADYWTEVSRGTITLTPAPETQGTVDDGIVEVTLASAHPDTAGNTGNANRQIVHDAIVASDAFVDYGAFDADADGYLDTDELLVYVVVRGAAAEVGESGCAGDPPSVWAHKWSLGFSGINAPSVDGVLVAHWRGAPTFGDQQGAYLQGGELYCFLGSHATIGVLAHETGHALGTGMPDLYDTDGSSEGIGEWGLMGSGSFQGSPPGTSPAWPSAWARWFFGFITPEQVTSSGAVTFPQVETDATVSGGVRQVFANPGGVDQEDGGSGEYFLIENRQLVGFDSGLNAAGLLIWHVDEGAADNENEGVAPGGSRIVALEQADGDYDLECYTGCNRGDVADPWHATNGTVFGPSTVPPSSFYDGSDSLLRIDSISASSASMSAFVCLTGDADGDADGTLDCKDGCPDDVNKTEPGECGCGVVEDADDDDGDSVLNCFDQCPGSDDAVDTDMDGVADGCDACPGSDDAADADGDTVPDGCDACPGSDDTADADMDGVPDDCDACAGSDDAEDADGDSVPDGCDQCAGSDDAVDSDSDGVADGCDACPGSSDADDADGDSVPDGCDQCAGSDDAVDADMDGVADGCDACPGSDDGADADGDSVPDGCDQCAGSDDAVDSDMDGVADGCDACPGSDDGDDADGDSVPDGCDQCAGSDDAVDADMDGVADGCDACP
ncbi:MAG: M6 family metalloprotease domain-containing protein, partial [Acidobacteriota bacterium]